MASLTRWIKRTCLASLLIFVVGTLAIIIALPFLTASRASEATIGILLFVPFLLLAFVSGVLLLILTIWDGVRQLFQAGAKTSIKGARAMRWSVAVCTLALFLVGSAIAQDHPAEKRSDDRWYQAVMATTAGHFSFQLPGRPPKPRSVQRVSGAGTKYTVLIWSAVFDGGAYQVQMATLPRDVDVTNPRHNLQATLDGDATLLKGGKFASTEWKEDQGLTAVDAVGRTISGRDMRVYSAMKGLRVFTLTYLGAAGSASTADVNRFIGSVRVH